MASPDLEISLNFISIPAFLEKEKIRTSGDPLQVEFWKVGMGVPGARDWGNLTEGSPPLSKGSIAGMIIELRGNNEKGSRGELLWCKDVARRMSSRHGINSV